MGYTTRLAYEPLRIFDSSTLTGLSYQPIGGPLLHPGTIVKMVNNSTILVTVSIDGVTNHDVCPSGSFWLYDETANAPRQANNAVFLPQGTQFSIKGAAGFGNIYLVVQYIVQG